MHAYLFLNNESVVLC